MIFGFFAEIKKVKSIFYVLYFTQKNRFDEFNSIDQRKVLNYFNDHLTL
jgi:hypothetical protein